MRQILTFLATEGAFLYEETGCRIVDSEYVATFGGTGSVTLRSTVLELTFWLDRDRLFMDVRASGSKRRSSRYSMDIIRQLLTGEVADKATMDRDNVDFLKQHFAEIEDRFNASNITATEAACKKLEIQRSKRLFG